MSTIDKLNLPPLEPWKPSSILRDAVASVREDMEKMRREREILLFLLHDEFISNGGHFQSTEADCVFRQTFAKDIDDTNVAIFTRLMRNKPTTLID